MSLFSQSSFQRVLSISLKSRRRDSRERASQSLELIQLIHSFASLKHSRHARLGAQPLGAQPLGAQPGKTLKNEHLVAKSASLTPGRNLPRIHAVGELHP